MVRNHLVKYLCLQQFVFSFQISRSRPNQTQTQQMGDNPAWHEINSNLQWWSEKSKQIKQKQHLVLRCLDQDSSCPSTFIPGCSLFLEKIMVVFCHLTPIATTAWIEVWPQGTLTLCYNNIVDLRHYTVASQINRVQLHRDETIYNDL